MRIILVLLFLITAISVEARMYQWTEPGVETTQLSGKPPAWYRSTAGGPRVFVFDNGRLIDDTAVNVSDEVRQRMREEAFILVEEDKQKAQEKIAKAEKTRKKQIKDKPETNKETTREEKVQQESTIELITEALFPKENKEEQQSEANLAEQSLDELKAIITDWEESRTQDAKQALE